MQPMFANKSARELIAALGGESNVERVESAALTRLRVELREPARIDEGALARAGAPGVWRLPTGAVHVIVGEDAAALAAAISEALSGNALSKA